MSNTEKEKIDRYNAKIVEYNLRIKDNNSLASKNTDYYTKILKLLKNKIILANILESTVLLGIILDPLFSLSIIVMLVSNYQLLNKYKRIEDEYKRKNNKLIIDNIRMYEELDQDLDEIDYLLIDNSESMHLDEEDRIVENPKIKKKCK